MRTGALPVLTMVSSDRPRRLRRSQMPSLRVAAETNVVAPRQHVMKALGFLGVTEQSGTILKRSDDMATTRTRKSRGHEMPVTVREGTLQAPSSTVLATPMEFDMPSRIAPAPPPGSPPRMNADYRRGFPFYVEDIRAPFDQGVNRTGDVSVTRWITYPGTDVGHRKGQVAYSDFDEDGSMVVQVTVLDRDGLGRFLLDPTDPDGPEIGDRVVSTAWLKECPSSSRTWPGTPTSMSLRRSTLFRSRSGPARTRHDSMSGRF